MMSSEKPLHNMFLPYCRVCAAGKLSPSQETSVFTASTPYVSSWHVETLTHRTSALNTGRHSVLFTRLHLLHRRKSDSALWYREHKPKCIYIHDLYSSFLSTVTHGRSTRIYIMGSTIASVAKRTRFKQSHHTNLLHRRTVQTDGIPSLPPLPLSLFLSKSIWSAFTKHYLHQRTFWLSVFFLCFF